MSILTMPEPSSYVSSNGSLTQTEHMNSIYFNENNTLTTIDESNESESDPQNQSKTIVKVTF